MHSELLAVKWFTIYYILLGLLSLVSGAVLLLRQTRCATYLLAAAEREKPPALFIRLLKYFFLFSLPGLVLSFIPFSWIELLFSLWSLLLVYLAGVQLVRWGQNRTLIRANRERLPALIQRCGAIMVAVGFTMFLLAYLVIKQAGSL